MNTLNKWRNAYCDRVRGRGYFEYLYELELIPEQIRDLLIVDLGCGAGNFMDEASNLATKSSGIDRWVLPTARNNLVQGDISNLPYMDNCFDFAVSVYAFGYYTSKTTVEDAKVEFFKQLSEALRVIKSSGEIIFVPHFGFQIVREKIILPLELPSTNEMFKVVFTIKELADLRFNIAGFECGSKSVKIKKSAIEES